MTAGPELGRRVSAVRTEGLAAALSAAAPQRVGVVSSIVGLSVEVAGLACPVGSVVRIGDGGVPAEVVAAQRSGLRCMPLGPLDRVAAGDPVRSNGRPALIPVGDGLMGRVLDGLGRPIDGKGPLGPHVRVPLENDPPAPLDRARITEQLQVGVRAVDTMTAVGRGQRIGLFAGSGVGKSSLLSMVARGTDAAVNVIALVGERGREVREFLEEDLGPEGLARSIVVVATSDEPARMRLRAAFAATRIAEFHRERGADVLLMMDSLTRVAMAQREIGLSAGEPPATRGYPPSTSRCSRASSNAPGRTPPGRSRASTRCWSTGTTTTNPSPTRPGPCSTATWCWTAGWPSPVTSRPSMSSPPCPAWPRA
jgi:flagellum-specific ATP synthase